MQFVILDKIKYPLVNQFYKRVYKKGRASKDEAVFILQQSGIVCSAKLINVEQHLVLTGVACDPSYRGKGYAARLIKRLLTLQTQPIYCFPYPYLQVFYARLGFVCIEPQTAPQEVNDKFTLYSKKSKLLLMHYSENNAKNA